MFSFFLFFRVYGPFAEDSNEIVIEKPKGPYLRKTERANSYLLKIPISQRDILKGNTYKTVYETKDNVVILINNPSDEIKEKSLYIFEDVPQKRQNSIIYDEYQFSFINYGQYNGIKGEDVNIEKVWNKGIFGKNVTLAIADDGCKTKHVEFRGRFNTDLNLNLNDDTKNVEPTEYDMHGTQVLGVAGAKENEYCITGAAPNATLVCHRYESVEATVYKLLKSFAASRDEIDVITNSWAIDCDINGAKRCYYYQSHPLVDEAIDDMMKNSRNGKGRIVIFAAGNEGNAGVNTNQYLFNKDRHFIGVSASTYKGGVAFYSGFGSCVFCNAPTSGQDSFMSAIDYTPYVDSVDMYGTETCSRMFGGTSASCPLVSGIVALMLEVNKELTWRDVQYIIALTATINDPLNRKWQKNGAGIFYSHYHGFGRIDADLAVETSRNWKTVPQETQEISKKEKIISPKFRENPRKIEFDFTGSVKFVESVVITFKEKTTTDISMLQINLTSPSGTTSPFKPVVTQKEYVSPELEYSFTIRDFFGEKSEGKWTVTIQNQDVFQVFSLINFTVSIFGAESIPSLPKIERRVGRDSLTPMNKGTDIKALPTAKEFYCNEDIRIDIESKYDFKDKHFRYYMDRTPAIGISETDGVTSIRVPCIFEEDLRTNITLYEFQGNYSDTFDIRVIHPRKDKNQKMRVIEPKENQHICSTKPFTIKWESWMPLDAYTSQWDMHVIVRILDSDTKETKFYTSEPWNNGIITANITEGFMCDHCLLTITPTDAGQYDTMVVPISISDKEVPTVPETPLIEWENKLSVTTIVLISFGGLFLLVNIVIIVVMVRYVITKKLLRNN